MTIVITDSTTGPYALLIRISTLTFVGNIVPKSALEILKRTLDTVRLRANSNGECFGGEIADAMREAGGSLGVDRLDLVLTRTILVRTMESLGESYPAEVLQDFESRMPFSKAFKYLNEAITWTARLREQENPMNMPSE